MKLGNFKRLISNDFKTEDQPLVEQLGTSLNNGIEQLFTALQNKLKFEDNFLCTYKEVEITVNDKGIPLTKASISLSNNETVKGCLVISATNKTNPTTYATGTPFISFTQNGYTLYIDNITGLKENHRFIIKLIAFN